MRIKIIPCIALACTLSFLVTGCESVTQVFNEIVDTDPSKQTVATGDAGSSVTAEDGKSVDKNLKAPVFNNLSGQSVAVAQDTNVSLDATANSLDGGKITYQWYVNNVGSNGGGTALEKAQNAVYQPDTSEVSVKYYYAVAKNEHESSYTMATSPVYEVKVIKKGEFTTDEFGGVRYLSEDGSYPSDIWVNIGEYTYYFNPDGYRTAGWVDTGAGQYYFDEEGRLLKNTVTPDGYQVDEKGLRIGEAAVAAEQPAAEQPAAEQPAAEQPAAEQPAEQPAAEQPFEEQPVEEQPAEEQPVE